jgi:hypothetical protein
MTRVSRPLVRRRRPVLPSGMPIALEALGRVLALLGDVVLGGAGVAPALLLVGLLGAASVAAAVAVVRVAAARGLLGAARPPARPDEDDDLPVLVSSSDPDADGHERSRAPGRPARVVVPALRPAA